MKTMIHLAVLVALSSCSAAKLERAEQYELYKNITKDVCADNPHEVLLAQHLYNQMLHTRLGPGY